MFDGNMFLPETGTPIRKIDRRRTRLALWLPDRLTVGPCMLTSLTFRRASSSEPIPIKLDVGLISIPAVRGALLGRPRGAGRFRAAGEAGSASLAPAPSSAGLLTTGTPA